MYNEDHAYWLGFSLISGIGTKRILHLREQFGSLKGAWSASLRELRESGLDERASELINTRRPQTDIRAAIESIREIGCRLLALSDDTYPALLKQIPDPPPVLYVLGDVNCLQSRAIAVVGTRKATRYGLDVATDLSRRLTEQGVVIVSGLAQGIDSAAHTACIDIEGQTVAVLGSGLDTIYPRESQDLADEIIKHGGAILSEFPIGMPPDRRNFPRRNRVISGISHGVLVVEAPLTSGALITAHAALEQGREVFAVPANIYNQAGLGGNRLIQDGAKLVMDVGDILEELNITYEAVETQRQAESIVPTNDIEAALIALMDADPIHIDELVRLSGLPVATVSSTLTLLELKGLAQTVGHMQYSRTYR